MTALTVADYVARAVLAGCVSRALWAWLSLEAIERRGRLIELAHEHGSFRALRGAIGDTMALRRQARWWGAL